MTLNRKEADIVRTGVILVTMVAAGTLFFATPASAQQSACDEVLNDRNNSSAGPGGQLADAIDNQGDEISNSLWDQWLDARLAEASSNESRARIIAQGVGQIDDRLTTIETCWWGERADGETVNNTANLDERQIESLLERVHSHHQRVNETRAAAANLSAPLRERYDIDNETFATLDRRVVALRASLNETA